MPGGRSGVWIFKKLDLRKAYHLFQIKEEDEYKSTFRTHCGVFEYRVMPFGLMNTLVIIQASIPVCLWLSIDHFVVFYLDDILIYSTNEKKPEDHGPKVLERLHQFGLYFKSEQCQYGASTFVSSDVSSALTQSALNQLP
jgi:hypothetical protein